MSAPVANVRETLLDDAKADVGHLLLLAETIEKLIALLGEEKSKPDGAAAIHRLTTDAVNTLARCTPRCDMQVRDIQEALGKMFAEPSCSDCLLHIEALMWFIRKPDRTIRIPQSCLRYRTEVSEQPALRVPCSDVIDVVAYDGVYWVLSGLGVLASRPEATQRFREWPLSTSVVTQNESGHRDVPSLFLAMISAETSLVLAEGAASVKQERSRSRSPPRHSLRAPLHTGIASAGNGAPLANVDPSEGTSSGKIGDILVAADTIACGDTLAVETTESAPAGPQHAALPSEYSMVIKAAEDLLAVDSNAKGGTTSFWLTFRTLALIVTCLAHPLRAEVENMLTTVRQSFQPKKPSTYRVACRNIRKLLLERWASGPADPFDNGVRDVDRTNQEAATPALQQ